MNDFTFDEDLDFFDDLDTTELIDEKTKVDEPDGTATPPATPPADPVVVDDEGDDEPGDDADKTAGAADDPDEPGDDESGFYTSAFDIFKEKGVIDVPDDFKFEATEAGFDAAIQATSDRLKEAVLEELRQDLPSEGLALIKYMKEGGRDLGKFINLYSQTDYSSLELTDDETKREVLKAYYSRTTKWSPEKISKHVTSLEVTGDFDEEAAAAQEELKALTAAEREALNTEAAAQKQARLDQEKEAFNSLSKVLSESKDINGYPVSKNDVGTVIPFLMKPIKIGDRITTAYNHKHAELMKDPKKAVLLAKLVQSDLDLSVLARKQESKVTSTVKTKLQNAVNYKGKIETGSKKEDWDELENL